MPLPTSMCDGNVVWADVELVNANANAEPPTTSIKPTTAPDRPMTPRRRGCPVSFEADTSEPRSTIASFSPARLTWWLSSSRGPPNCTFVAPRCVSVARSKNERSLGTGGNGAARAGQCATIGNRVVVHRRIAPLVKSDSLRATERTDAMTVADRCIDLEVPGPICFHHAFR